jgi:transcriptional regulator with XRE-family HTH domain
MKYDNTEFRDVLKQELEYMGKTQKEFAALCNMTQETLTRYLSVTKPRRPSRSMLKRIADNTSVSYDDWLKFCGYEKPYGFLEDDSVTRCIHNLEHMMTGFNELSQNRRLYESMDEFLIAYRMLYSQESVKFQVTKKQEYEGHLVFDAEYFSIVVAVFDTVGRECKTFGVLYFAETQGGRFLPLGFDISGKALSDVGFFNEGMIQSIYEKGENPETLKYYYTISLSSGKAEERLLKAIFGEEDSDLTYMATVEGFGMILNEKPVGFENFVVNHKDTFIGSDYERQVYDAIVNHEKPDLVANYCDDETWSGGYGAVIGKIIRAETDVDIRWYESSAEGYDSCLMVDHESEDYEPRELKSILYPYVKELGLHQFGACIYYQKRSLDSREIFTV